MQLLIFSNPTKMSFHSSLCIYTQYIFYLSLCLLSYVLQKFGLNTNIWPQVLIRKIFPKSISIGVGNEESQEINICILEGVRSVSWGPSSRLWTHLGLVCIRDQEVEGLISQLPFVINWKLPPGASTCLVPNVCFAQGEQCPESTETYKAQGVQDDASK